MREGPSHDGALLVMNFWMSVCFLMGKKKKGVDVDGRGRSGRSRERGLKLKC